MNEICRLDLQGIHVDLIEKFRYENIHSTYYDVFDDGGQNTSVYLYSFINPFYHHNIYDENLQLLMNGNNSVVTSEKLKYGDFRIKHYKNKEIINLITFQPKFDIYSNFGDIVEIIDRNCYRMSEEEFKEELQGKIKEYTKL